MYMFSFYLFSPDREGKDLLQGCFEFFQVHLCVDSLSEKGTFKSINVKQCININSFLTFHNNCHLLSHLLFTANNMDSD